ncbi:MAG: hypothetical protein AMXMBFR56_63890 [Polyangiaceae bacterium]
MPEPRDWAEPFRRQASEDLLGAQAAYEAGAFSTYCMLMQMVFEKLAKAAFARSGAPVPRNHQVATRLIEVLRRTPAGGAIMIGGDRTLAAIQELEAAHPAVVADAVRRGAATQYPQLEYPWENASAGAVEWPGEHLPMARRVKDPADRIGADLLKTARAFLKHFDAMFP